MIAVLWILQSHDYFVMVVAVVLVVAGLITVHRTWTTNETSALNLLVGVVMFACGVAWFVVTLSNGADRVATQRHERQALASATYNQAIQDLHRDGYPVVRNLNLANNTVVVGDGKCWVSTGLLIADHHYVAGTGVINTRPTGSVPGHHLVSAKQIIDLSPTCNS